MDEAQPQKRANFKAFGNLKPQGDVSGKLLDPVQPGWERLMKDGERQTKPSP